MYSSIRMSYVEGIQSLNSYTDRVHLATLLTFPFNICTPMYTLHTLPVTPTQIYLHLSIIPAHEHMVLK